MKKNQSFQHEMFGALRVVTTDDQKTLFNLTDVCRALTLANVARTKKRLKPRSVTTVNTPTKNQHGATAVQPMTYIDEPNLYRCIFQSRKAEAEKFQDWVFEEVLPQAINAMMKVYRQSVMCDTYDEICRNVVIFYEDIEGTDTRNKTVQRKKKKSNQKKIVRNNNNKIIEFFRK